MRTWEQQRHSEEDLARKEEGEVISGSQQRVAAAVEPWFFMLPRFTFKAESRDIVTLCGRFDGSIEYSFWAIDPAASSAGW